MSTWERVEAPQTYQLVGSKGETITICKELFEAIRDFKERKAFGSITLEFRSGGIAGIKSLTQWTYK